MIVLQMKWSRLQDRSRRSNFLAEITGWKMWEGDIFRFVYGKVADVMVAFQSWKFPYHRTYLHLFRSARAKVSRRNMRPIAAMVVSVVDWDENLSHDDGRNFVTQIKRKQSKQKQLPAVIRCRQTMYACAQRIEYMKNWKRKQLQRYERGIEIGCRKWRR